MPLNFIIQWTVLTFFLCFFLGLAYVFGGPYLLVFIFYKSSNRDCVGDFLNSAFSRGAEVLFSFLKSDSKIFILSGLWTLPVKFFVRLVFDFILLSFFEFQIMKTAILKWFFVVVLCSHWTVPPCFLFVFCSFVDFILTDRMRFVNKKF